MAADLVRSVGDVFWADSFWLPNNLTWNDVISKRESGEMYLPLPRDLWAPFPIAVGLFVARLLWERFVALPIGQYYKICERQPRKAVPNELLERAYKKYGKRPPSNDVIVAIAKQTDWSVRHVERWWRRRRVQNKPSEMQRFKETSWRFLFYLVAFWYGIAVLWNKEYLWDTRHCWYGYPWQPIPDEIYWYYMVELGFYWSLVLSLFMDVKRKDFIEMVIHHIATIGLMSFSWADGMVRIGTLVLVVHDAVDYWMEGAKLAKYLRYHKLCDVLFVIFATMWFITRIVIYPVRILKSSILESWEILGPYTSCYLFNGLLLVIQALNLIWFYMILRMVYRYVITGKIEKDERSETEPETASDDDVILAKNADEVPMEYQSNGKNGAPVRNNNKAKVNSMSACEGSW